MTPPPRLSRLLALVPYLLGRPHAPVEDVAKTFGVSVDQLHKDLKLVWMCGLPGYFPGDLIEVEFEGDTVTVSNADTIARPLRLAADEAVALLVGLRTLAQVPGPGEQEVIARTLAKVESAAGDAAAVSTAVTVDVEADTAVVEAVRDALARERRLHLSYYVPNRDETTERDVDPIRLHVVAGRTYLEGWCRNVDDVRLFRLDRVVHVSVLDVAADPPAEAEPRDLSEGLFRPSPDDESVVMDLTPAGRWVADYYPCESVEEIADGGLRVTLRTPDTRWVRRLALRLGSSGRVVLPADLASQVRNDAEAALRAYALE
ncbi:MAG: proteasome accessory factor [Frankiales bacterium]|jgi:proteasome accessory factor C|nr:proteasome accessory factor [Frankiales bacterium]